MITDALYQYTRDLLALQTYTNKQVAEITGLGKNVVKDIDKKRLQEKYTIDGKALIKPDRQAKYLGIDEFKSHDGHQRTKKQSAFHNRSLFCYKKVGIASANRTKAMVKYKWVYSLFKEVVQMVQNWNDEWRVWKEDNAFRLIFSVPDFADKVDLPYDAVFHTQQRKDSVNQGRTGFLDGGVFHYYKELEITEENHSKHLSLMFDGVGGCSSVYVNGCLAGENKYAYSEFMVDITPWIKPEGKNQILVTVNAMDESSRYYCGGGIDRDVWLISQERVRILPETLRCTTERINTHQATVLIEAELQNELLQMKECLATCYVRKDGRLIHENRKPVTLPPDQSYHYTSRLLLEDILPWDEDHPELYEIQLSLNSKNQQTFDTSEILTGFRKLSLDSKNGLMVNGRPVKLRGACVHHDQGLLGGETYESMELRRVRILKEAGFNAVRCAHNPASKSLLQACDRLGMYVMDEAFDMWAKMKNPQDYALFFSRDWEQALKAMVRVDYNHPCVILYSTGNEITEIGTEKGYQISHRLTELLHQQDPTRFVTNGINGIFAAGNRLIQAFTEITGEEAPEAIRGDINQCMSVLGRHMNRVVRHAEISDILDHLDGTMDILGYNYMTGRYAEDCAAHPDRFIVGTETYPKQIAENWELVMGNPRLLGDFTWTGWDYLGETGGPENYPWLQNFSGDIDATGERKPVSYYREIVFGLRNVPYIAVRSPENSAAPRPGNPWQLTDAEPSWHFPKAEGRNVTVEVYSSGDEIELWLNGQSLGRKAADGLYRHFQTFDILYQPGLLEAVSYLNGARIGCYRLQTAGGAHSLHVEKEVFCQCGEDIVFLTVEGRDAEGLRVRDTISRLSISADSQNVTLLAFGSSGSVHRAGYTRSETDALHGRAVAVLKKKSDGEACITLSAEGLTETRMMI